MRLDTRDHFVLDMYRSAQDCSLPAFTDFAFQQLKKQVHFDAAGIADCIVSPDRQIVMRTLQLHQTTIDRFKERAEVVGSENLAANGAVNSRDVLMQTAFKPPRYTQVRTAAQLA